MIEGTVSLKCSRCNHCEVCQWVDLKMNGCDWFEEEQRTGWIPISERLPEIHQDILLSFRSLDVEVGFRANSEPYFYCNGTYIEPQNVLAWMPLPKPYKAESEGKEDDR